MFLAHNIPEFTGAAFSFLTLLAALFVADWRMALATLALPAVGVTVQVVMFFRGAASIREWSLAQERMNATMLQYIQGMPLIKAFNHTVRSFRQYRDSVENCRLLEDKANRKWYLALSVFNAALPNALVVILPVGAWLYMQGGLTLQSLTLFLLLGPALAGPVMILALFWHHLERIFEAQGRIRGVLDEQPLPETDAPERPGDDLSGEGVTFSYQPGMPVVRGVDFRVEPGGSMALVGPSGAGKTTLARLIPRFWDVEEGAIRMGETDIRAMGTDEVMRQTAFVFQNVQLFNDTVAGNLRMAKPEATDLELETVARAARCHEFIAALPHGYDTRIGENGLFPVRRGKAAPVHRQGHAQGCSHRGPGRGHGIHRSGKRGSMSRRPSTNWPGAGC